MAHLICPDLSSVSLGFAGPMLMFLFQDDRQSCNGLCLQVLVIVHDDGPLNSPSNSTALYPRFSEL